MKIHTKVSGLSGLLLSGICAVTMMTGCQKTPTEEVVVTDKTAATETAQSTQDIKIATESSYKPFSYTDADGNLIGYEIDLTKVICAQMNANCDIISQDWDGLIPGLNAKKFDAIIAGMSITPERLEVVDFSDPYFHSGIVLVAKKGSDISMDNLTGVPVGAQRSTVSSQYLQDNHPEADIKLYDTQENAYLDLSSGRVDALLADKVIANDWLNTDAGQNYETKGAEISSDDDAMGIAFRKGDPLVAKFNAALAELKQDGQYDEITERYFGTSSTAAAHANHDMTANDVEQVVVVEGDGVDVDGAKLVEAEETAAN